MKSYFGVGVTCIYLDQFAASHMLDQPGSDLWDKIGRLLTEKSKTEKLICPVPTEHFLESANKKKDNALAMDKLFYELAKGIAFRPEAAVTANQIIGIIRQLPLTKETFCDELKYSETLSQDGAFDGFKSRHGLLGSQTKEGAAAQNEFRQLLINKRFPRSVMEPMFQAVKSLQIRPFLDRINELLEKGQIISRGVSFSTGEVIDWVDVILQLLIFQHEMTAAECIQLRDIIDQTGFDSFPALDIRITLTANLTIEHKTETVNDHIDIMRLATGLSAADLLFTDKQRKHELQQTGLAAKYQTEVFSGTVTDLTTFYERLLLI